MKTLNPKQRKFLEYLNKHHQCLGLNVTIPDMLVRGVYNEIVIKRILMDWEYYKAGHWDKMQHSKFVRDNDLGTPKNYWN